MRHAILIPGLLRCVDYELFAFLDSINEPFHVIIVTDTMYAHVAELIAQKYPASIIYSDTAMGLSGDIDPELFQGSRAQIYKLHLAFKHMKLIEESSGVRFTFFHKIRTDIKYGLPFSEFVTPALLAAVNENKTIVNQYDFMFSASASAYALLADYPLFAQAFLTDDQFFKSVIIQFNREQLDLSDFYSAAYSGAFPIGILANNTEALERSLAQTRKRFSDCREAITSFFDSQIESKASKEHFGELALKNSQFILSWHGTYQPKWPEHIWTRYLNYVGVPTRSYGIKLSLRLARFALTPFTEQLLSNLEGGNIAFLDSPIKWEHEIHSFLRNGGSNIKLAQILCNICIRHSAQMSDIQFSSAFLAIELLNCTYLPIYSHEFRALCIKRDVTLPWLPL